MGKGFMGCRLLSHRMLVQILDVTALVGFGVDGVKPLTLKPIKNLPLRSVPKFP